jgi:hypothetical protein
MIELICQSLHCGNKAICQRDIRLANGRLEANCLPFSLSLSLSLSFSLSPANASMYLCCCFFFLSFFPLKEFYEFYNLGFFASFRETAWMDYIKVKKDTEK